MSTTTETTVIFFIFEGFVIPESCALAAVVHRELGVKHKPASPTASLRTRRQRAHRISSFMSSFLLCDGCGLQSKVCVYVGLSLNRHLYQVEVEMNVAVK